MLWRRLFKKHTLPVLNLMDMHHAIYRLQSTLAHSQIQSQNVYLPHHISFNGSKALHTSGVLVCGVK